MTRLNPYEPSSHFPVKSVQEKRRRYVTLATTVVSITAIAKWFVPAVIGTGAIYTLGTWIEEWLIAFFLGIFFALSDAKSSKWQPLLFFLVAYLLHFPVFANDRFVLLIVAVGIVTTVFMYLGVMFGMLLRFIGKSIVSWQRSLNG